MLAGDGLHPSSKGARVDFSGDGEKKVIDGPFAETKELLAGYWIWQVKSFDEAIEWVEARSRATRRARRHRRAAAGLRARRLRRGADPRAAREGASSCGRRPRPTVAVEKLSTRGDGRRQPHDRGRLADRVGAADRRPGADRARRRPRRGPRAGGARRRARAVAPVRRPGQPGRLADGHRQAPGDRPPAPCRGARAQDARARARARAPRRGRAARSRGRGSTTRSTTTSCG